MTMVVKATDLRVGDVITDDGPVTVLTTPTLQADGRLHFMGGDKRGESDHATQPTFTYTVDRKGSE